MSTWSPERLAALLGAIIPVVVAIATYVGAEAKVKAFIAGILAWIGGPVLTFIQTNESLVSWASARSGLVAWAVALLTYLAAWKPIIALNSRPFVLPQSGIGKPSA